MSARCRCAVTVACFFLCCVFLALEDRGYGIVLVRVLSSFSTFALIYPTIAFGDFATHLASAATHELSPHSLRRAALYRLWRARWASKAATTASCTAPRA